MKVKACLVKIVFTVFVVAMMVLIVSALSVTASAADGYNGTPKLPTVINSENYDDFGLTADNWSTYNGYYAITTAEEMMGWADMIREGYEKNDTSVYGRNGVLLSDIIINPGDMIAAGDANTPPTYKWEPIGNFRGVLDGRGHTLSGIYIDRGNSYAAIFECIQGHIKNLTISNSYVKGGSSYNAMLTSNSWAGAGIYNCKLDTNVKVTGSVTVGGFACEAEMLQIQNCVTLATTASVRYSGAFIARDSSDYPTTFYNCYYTDTTKAAIGTNLGSVNKDGVSRVDVKNHTCIAMEHPATVATCLVRGNSAYSDCMICGNVLSGAKNVGDFGHEWVDASCIEPKTCVLCKATEGKENGHSNFEYVAEGNSIISICGVCGEDLTKVTINAPEGNLVYNGEAKAATISGSVSNVEELKIIYSDGVSEFDIPPVNPGTYTATIAVGEVKASVQFTIDKITLTADDFILEPPLNLVYDANEKNACVYAKESLNVGTITVKYYNKDGEQIISPISVGEYIVKIDVEDSEFYLSATDIMLGELIITPAVVEDVSSPKASAIEYGKTLSESVLSDGWSWLDQTIVADGSLYKAYFMVDDVNYDYSSVEGYDADKHWILSDVAVGVLSVMPEITLSDVPAVVCPNTDITVSASAKNPYNANLADVFEIVFTYKIGDGAELPFDRSFNVSDLPSGTIINIKAYIEENGFYLQSIAEKTVTIRVHEYTNDCDGDCNLCEQDRTPSEHIDENNDGKCDSCEQPMSVPETEAPAESTPESETDADTDVVTDTDTETETDVVTDTDTDETYVDTSVIEAPETDLPITKAPETEENDDEKDVKGCSVSISGIAVAFVSVMSLGVVIKKKKD